MYNLDIVIPAINEKDNLVPLLKRIAKAFSNTDITVNPIFVVDASTDGTLEELDKLSKKHRISFYPKEGYPKGKGYSLIQGLKTAESDYVSFIDADLQYPPEELPKMLDTLIKEDLGLVIANRKTYSSPGFLRKFVSRANKLVFSKLLHGHSHDTQSGMKVFKRDIFHAMDHDEVGPWTFDVPLVVACKTLGYKIGSHDIDFKVREASSSSIRVAKASYYMVCLHYEVSLKSTLFEFPMKIPIEVM